MSGEAYDLLIVGGGQAARRAAEGARGVSPDLSIAILGEEAHAPYDRPPLSKAALENPEGFKACEIRDRESYGADRIDLHLRQRVIRIERETRTIVTETGDRFAYGALILATGSRVRRLPVAPALAERVLTLRTRDDAEQLAATLAPDVRVVVIGAGFIGLEVASAAVARRAKVTVLEAADRVLARVMPAAAAEYAAALHRAAGVALHLGVKVGDMGLDDCGAVRIETSTGAFLADVVVVGIGVRPNVELAEAAGLPVDDGILVAADGSTVDPHIFAAGEVTRHPAPGYEHPARFESWQVAELQAETAGRAAAGAPAAHQVIPWFWSDQLGCNIQMLGRVPPDAPLVARRYPDGSASLFALDEAGRLTGMVAFDAGRDVAVMKRLLAKGSAPSAGQLENVDTPLRQLLS
jgi:anthranilate 1,2-dioxygenase ferredoxin reductase subunit